MEEVSSLFSGESGCLVLSFFLVFCFEKLFLRRERFVRCFVFSYGRDSGDQCGKAYFICVISIRQLLC